jgi:hypothetical protein
MCGCVRKAIAGLTIIALASPACGSAGLGRDAMSLLDTGGTGAMDASPGADAASGSDGALDQDATDVADGGSPADATAGLDAMPSIDAMQSDGAPSGTDALPGMDALPNNGRCLGSVPLTYNAPTDRNPHMTSPPTLGPAGSMVTDPVYGTQLLRITDETTGGPTISYRVANEFWGVDWNTDSTMFYIQGSSGGFVPYNFDPRMLKATRVMDNARPGQPLRMPLAPGGFSRRSPTIFLGLHGLVMSKFDFSTQTKTDIVDLTTLVPGATGYALSVEEGANGLLATSFGGPEQDRMPYVLTYDPVTQAQHVIDVVQSTLDGHPIGATIGGGVHTVKIDQTGRWVTFSVSGGAHTDWLWDTATGTVSASPTLGTIGAGGFVKKGGGDAYNWQTGSLSSPAMMTALIAPLLTPTDNLASSSLAWQNAAAGGSVPVIVETMRQPADMGPWRAWDNELLAVATDGSAQVWRFAHNFSTYSGTIFSDAFYYLFIPRVSQNGWFVIFDSNWNQTLGTDASGSPRTDAFIAILPNPCGP